MQEPAVLKNLKVVDLSGSDGARRNPGHHKVKSTKKSSGATDRDGRNAESRERRERTRTPGTLNAERFRSSGLQGGSIPLSGVIPVDDVPERFDVFCTTILVFEVVGMFPNVDANDWNLFLVRF